MILITSIMFIGLSYYDDTKRDPWSVMHKPVQWWEIKTFFLKLQKQLLKMLINDGIFLKDDCSGALNLLFQLPGSQAPVL